MPYGAHQAEIQAQQAVPLQNVPAPGPASPPSPTPAGMPSSPVQLGDFTRPTERPTEPVTAGLPMGPGPGPEALTSGGPAADQIGLQLRSLYQQNPNNDLLRLIQLHDNGY